MNFYAMTAQLRADEDAAKALDYLASARETLEKLEKAITGGKLLAAQDTSRRLGREVAELTSYVALYSARAEEMRDFERHEALSNKGS